MKMSQRQSVNMWSIEKQEVPMNLSQEAGLSCRHPSFPMLTATQRIGNFENRNLNSELPYSILNDNLCISLCFSTKKYQLVHENTLFPTFNSSPN